MVVRFWTFFLRAFKTQLPSRLQEILPSCTFAPGQGDFEVHLQDALGKNTKFNSHPLLICCSKGSTNIVRQYFWICGGHYTTRTMFPGFWSFLGRGPRWTFPFAWETPLKTWPWIFTWVCSWTSLKLVSFSRASFRTSDPSKFGTSPFLFSKYCSFTVPADGLRFDATFTTSHANVPIHSIPGRLGNLLQGRSISSSSVAFHGAPEKAVDGQWGDNTFCEYCAQNDPLHVCASTRRQEIAEWDLRF